jgi:glycosyltransferase involved in cell wall biosynthesis
MKILLLCYEHPSPSIAGSLRALHSLKYLSDKYEHDITLLAFQLTGKGYPDLSRYCRVETIDIPRWPSLKSPQAIASALKTVASPRNVFSGHYSLLNYNYSPGMDAKVKTLLDNRFDALVVDHPSMLRYALGQKIPLVLMEAFALAEITWMEYKLERNWLRKIIRLLYHYQTRNYTKIYNDVDMAIAVSNHQRDMVKSHCPDLRIEVIPHGVDTDYFKAIESEAGSPGLIITGQMSGPRNKSAVLYFYNKIYSLIKAAVPQVKLYVVGSNPEEEILLPVMWRISDLTFPAPGLSWRLFKRALVSRLEFCRRWRWANRWCPALR